MSEEPPEKEEKTPKLLEDMPEELMKRISEEAGFLAIQHISLVNKNFHTFIQSTKPEFHIQEMFIKLPENQVIMEIDIGKMSKKITFKKQMEHTEIIRKNTKKLVENSNYLDVFFEEFRSILFHQKSVFKKFSFNIGQVDAYKRFAEGEKLKVSYLHIRGRDEDIKEFLSLVDPKFLKKLGFYSIRSEEVIEEIVTTDQWKMAEEMYIYRTTGLKIPDYSHFNKLEIQVNSMNADELERLRKIYSENPSFKSALIQYHHYTVLNRDQEANRQNLFQQDNNPELGDSEEKELYYRIPNSDFVIFHFFCNRRSKFARIPLASVPERAVLMDI